MIKTVSSSINTIEFSLNLQQTKFVAKFYYEIVIALSFIISCIVYIVTWAKLVARLDRFVL